MFRREGNEIELQEAQSANIQVDDGIELGKLEEQGYSILDFADNLEVELFSDTSVFLNSLRQGAEDVTEVTLHLDRGHMFVHPNVQTTSRVTVQTLYTTIKTLTSGTEFDVCHTEELTCVLVKKGVVEITAKGRKALVKAGEAGYVLKDESPSATICAPISRFTKWEERYRLSADTPALDKELSSLKQNPCPMTTSELPVNARILYQDQFINPFSGWAKGKIDHFNVRYAGLRFYRIQAQGPNARLLASVPKEPTYADVNIDVRAIAEAPSSGDFRYGMVFRRTGDQYYAFVISPVTKTWHFLKSSSTGLETVREGIDERMHGLDSREALRVEAYGSTFLVFINGRFIDWIGDPEYASGEVALFVETLDNPDAQVRFDSIVLWDMQPTVPTPNQGGREYCFNIRDDDGDRLIDRADPDCQRLDLNATSLPQPTNTSIAAETSTPQPTNTSLVPKTFTPQPTRTLIPPRTSTPQPTRTFIPPRTSTSQPTRTLIPQPTRTPVPQPTRTLIPQPTRTPVPQPTRTLIPQPTRTPVPQPTRTLIPPRTSTSQPTSPPPTATDRPPPTATDPPPPPTATDPPPPTATDPPPPPTATDPPPPTAT
ncbi:MAG TPA: hypothetical protein VJM08_09795, partial [Anaerolineales bacterium]|nr:hypothetical protein [Anaerolineales bacterium]